MDRGTESAIDAACPAVRRRCFRFETIAGVLWIKRPRSGPGRAVWLLQRALAGLTGQPVLAPPAVSIGADGLRQEARRLRRLGERGWPVPAVAGLTDRWLAMTDNGASVEVLIRRAADDAARGALADGALDFLLGLHGRGGWHGGAQLRNITRRDDGYAVIDLEDDLEHSMSLPARQARDLLLLLLSAASWDGKGVVLGELAARARAGADPATRRAFDRACGSLARIRRLTAPVQRLLGNDGKRLVLLADALA